MKPQLKSAYRHSDRRVPIPGNPTSGRPGRRLACLISAQVRAAAELAFSRSWSTSMLLPPSQEMTVPET